jgi:hypothetical protein
MEEQINSKINKGAFVDLCTDDSHSEDNELGDNGVALLCSKKTSNIIHLSLCISMLIKQRTKLLQWEPSRFPSPPGTA